MFQVKSPILFLIFNRPNESKILFNAIRSAKPSKLYVAADGPRDNGIDEGLCLETKSILDQIDWDCKLVTLFRDKNLGCGKAVSGAINWFFENEEEGIILEDDCLPSLDFFRFCDEMLNKYRNDHRIGHICGCNFQDRIKRGSADYYFSKLTHVWGWASWRRVWNNYDFEMTRLDSAHKIDFLSSLTQISKFKKHIYQELYKTQAGIINTWDYQYFFSNQINSYLSIIPNYNLISNIGFNQDGTHTIEANSPKSKIDFEKLPNVIIHPETVYPNYDADNYTLKNEMPKYFQIKTSEVKGMIRDFLVKLKLYKPIL
jgi:hypothetical protein